MNLGQTASFWTKGWVESTEVNCSLFFPLLLFQFPDKVLQHSLFLPGTLLFVGANTTHNSVGGELLIALDNSVERTFSPWEWLKSYTISLAFHKYYLKTGQNKTETKLKKVKYEELNPRYMKVNHMRYVYSVTISCQFRALNVNLSKTLWSYWMSSLIRGFINFTWFSVSLVAWICFAQNIKSPVYPSVSLCQLHLP